MGDLRPDNGSGSPADDGGRGLPDLPPEWGTVVIPDDPAELATEAEALRRELRGAARRHRMRTFLGLRAGAPSSLGIPVVIMTVAILTTMVSLLVVTWGNQPPGMLPNQATPTVAGTRTGTTDTTTPLSDLIFITSAGDDQRLGDVLPAVVLLVDGCSCDQLIKAVAAVVPAGVRVLAVTRTTPTPLPGETRAAGATGPPPVVLRLGDPGGSLRARYFPAASPTGPDDANALLVNSSGKVVRTIPHAASAADITPVTVG